MVEINSKFEEMVLGFEEQGGGWFKSKRAEFFPIFSEFSWLLYFNLTRGTFWSLYYSIKGPMVNSMPFPLF